MASLILACITCCRPQNRHGKQSFLSTSTTPKHKRHQHNPPITMPSRTGSTTTTPVPGTAGTRPKMSGDYTFETLKMENERRVRKLAEAGVMDVPHGVLSREVGTPEVVPRYGDVEEFGMEAWRLDGEVPVEGRTVERQILEGSRRGVDQGNGRGTREEEIQPAPREWIQPPERAHVEGGDGAAVR